jgi:carboxypeptidase Q
MARMRFLRNCLVPLLGLPLLAFGQASDTLAKLRVEAMEHSQVVPVFDMFTVTIGPRLTASPAHKRAAEWTREWLASHGLENARLEPFQFGRSWTLEKLTIEMIEPRYMPLIGYADAWSPSTSGEIVAAPVSIAGKSPEEIATMGARLKGAIVLTQPLMTNFVRQDRAQPSDPGYTTPPAAAPGPGRGGAGRAQAVAQAIREAGVAVVLKPSRGEHGTVFVQGRDAGDNATPAVTLAGEHYNLIMQMLEQGVPVKLRVNVQSKFPDDGGKTYNVLAELPGTDPAVRDEIVMIGGHLDCWHSGVGATDNADGAAAVMEAMRILKATGARPRRTIRVAIWSGEEQGLLGSKAWIAQHLAGDANALARAKFDVYFNVDAGSGPIYGWYLQNREDVRPIFDAWIEPLKQFGVRRNVIDSLGNSDHVTFNDLGLPGFNPIQDYVNYDVRTHHTNMDTPERLQVKDIRQAALVTAWFAYQAAMAEQKFPRAAAK